MTTRLCPVSYAELRVGSTETRVSCPRCSTFHAREFLADRDDTLCSCGHRRAAHGRRHGLAYACPLPTCNCREPNPKEKLMANTKTDHYESGIDNLADAAKWPDATPFSQHHIALAQVHMLAAQVDATRAQTAAIQELIKAVREPVVTRMDAP